LASLSWAHQLARVQNHCCLHDIPKCIRPKFADDLVQVSIAHNVSEIASELQEATNQLVQWAENEGMVIRVEKTKVMLFGEVSKNVSIKIYNTALKMFQLVI